MEGNGKYPADVRERAIRMVLETQGDHASEWDAIRSAADTIGCTPGTLRRWVKEAERDARTRSGPTLAEARRMEALAQRDRELQLGNAILRKVSALFERVDGEGAAE